MSYLVIAYPVLSFADTQWLQQIREQHDAELAQVVAPHFTLVFPLAAMEPQQVIQHVKAQVQSWQQIPFVLRCALPYKDALSEATSVFLVPEEGLSALINLHDALYRGVLASALRLDIPFLPHITVGMTRNPWEAKALADQVNREPLAIQGMLEALDVISFENMAVETLARIPFLPTTSFKLPAPTR